MPACICSQHGPELPLVMPTQGKLWLQLGHRSLPHCCSAALSDRAGGTLVRHAGKARSIPVMVWLCSSRSCFHAQDLAAAARLGAALPQAGWRWLGLCQLPWCCVASLPVLGQCFLLCAKSHSLVLSQGFLCQVCIGEQHLFFLGRVRVYPCDQEPTADMESIFCITHSTHHP